MASLKTEVFRDFLKLYHIFEILVNKNTTNESRKILGNLPNSNKMKLFL